MSDRFEFRLNLAEQLVTRNSRSAVLAATIKLLSCGLAAEACD